VKGDMQRDVQRAIAAALSVPARPGTRKTPRASHVVDGRVPPCHTLELLMREAYERGAPRDAILAIPAAMARVIDGWYGLESATPTLSLCDAHRAETQVQGSFDSCLAELLTTPDAPRALYDRAQRHAGRQLAATVALCLALGHAADSAELNADDSAPSRRQQYATGRVIAGR